MNDASGALTVVTALRTEHAALRGRVGDRHRTELMRCGMGPTRARRWLDEHGPRLPQVLIVAGLAGGLDRSLRAGDVVVASELRDELGTIVLADPAGLFGQLESIGVKAHTGAIVSTDHIVTSADERAGLAATGALAVDMESAGVVRWFRERSAGLPIAVVRVIVDTPDSPVHRLGTVSAGIVALRALRRLGPALPRWAEAYPAGSMMDLTAGAAPGSEPVPTTSAVPEGVA